MSYGFGIGDFLAVGELCWKLYREVYRVARNSPREVQLLQQDLSNLNTVVRALQEDCTRPGSSIAQAPPERVKIGRDILGRVENILRSLEDIATRYPLLLQPADTSSGMGSRLRRQVQRILYAGHVREINDCRAQLSHQTGLLQLLLLAANNSSLERIQNQNDRLSTSVEDIRQYIHNPKPGLSSPLISASSYDEQSQFELSRRFNEKAVLNNTAWSAIGIDIWIQIGKWWLMKAQPNLNTPASEDYCQAYVNLLKASWILIDIIAVHPQLNFLSQQLDIQHLGQVIKNEHKNLEMRGIRKPSFEQVISADLTIWTRNASTMLLPILHSAPVDKEVFWRSGSGNILFQRFGYYLSRTIHSELECVVLFISDVQKKRTSVVVQGSDGQDVLRIDDCSTMKTSNRDGRNLITIQESASPNYRPETIGFSSYDSARLLFLLISGISSFRRKFPQTSFDARTLYAGAFFECLSAYDESDDTPTNSRRDDIQLLSNPYLDFPDSVSIGDLWDIALQLSRHADPAPSLWHWLLVRSLIHPVTAVSWILWADIPITDRINTVNSLTSDRKGCQAFPKEAVQAAVLLRDAELLEAVLETLGLISVSLTRSGDASLPDTFVLTLLKLASHIYDSAGPYTLFCAAFELRSPDLLKVAVTLGGKAQSIEAFTSTLDRIVHRTSLRIDMRIRADDFRFFCNHVFDCLDDGLTYDNASWEEKHLIEVAGTFSPILGYEGLEYSLPYMGGRYRVDLLMPAILSSNAIDLLRLLKKHDYLYPNCDPVKRREKVEGYVMASLWEMGLPDRIHEFPCWQADPTMPHWPLYVSICLMREPEVITCLITSGARLCAGDHAGGPERPDGATNLGLSEIQILVLLRSFTTLEIARGKFLDFICGLKETIKFFLEDSWYRTCRQPPDGSFFSCADLLGLDWEEYQERSYWNFSDYRWRITGGLDRAPDLPEALQSEEKLITWRDSVIEILEEAAKNPPDIRFPFPIRNQRC